LTAAYGLKLLQSMRFEARSLFPEIRVFIVQRGLSKSDVTPDHCEVLGTAKLYLHETVGITFVAAGST